MSDPKTNFLEFCRTMGYPEPNPFQLELVARIEAGERVIIQRPRPYRKSEFYDAFVKYYSQPSSPKPTEITVIFDDIPHTLPKPEPVSENELFFKNYIMCDWREEEPKEIKS